MKLTGKQVQQLHDALLSAYPTPGALAQMVRYVLDKNLNVIADSGNLSGTTFDLITWAEAHGRLPTLLNGAQAQNPDNAELDQVVTAINDAQFVMKQENAANEVEWQAEETISKGRGEFIDSATRLTSASRVKRSGSAKTGSQHDRFAYDVFLSHSSKDKPTVRALAERLRADGLHVWLDEWVIEPGDMIGLKIEEGLTQSRTLILCMSEAAFGSDWVTMERHTVLFRDPTNSQRRFIPLRLDECIIPDMIAQFAYVDWRTPTEESYARLHRVCRHASSNADAAQAQLAEPAPEQDKGADPKPVQEAADLCSISAQKKATPASTNSVFAEPGAAQMILDDPLVLGFGPINALAVTPDGRYIVGGSDDRTVKVWERASGRLLATFEGHGEPVLSVAVTPDGSQIISGSDDGTVKVWERASGRCLTTYGGHGTSVLSVAVTSDGSQIISGSYDRTVKLWERVSGRCLATFEGHGARVLSVAVTPDGSQIISGSEDRTVKVWERANGTCLATYEGHVNLVRSVAVTPNGSQIISSSDDGTVKVWERTSGRCLVTYKGHDASVLSVAVIPDGSQIISSSADGTVKVWERVSGTCLATFEGHGESVWSVAVTPDGSQIISGSYDRTVKLWERASGRCLVTYKGHVSSVLSVAVTPDGSQIISGSSDRTVKVWERASGHCLATFEGHGARVLSVAVTPDGSQIISGSEDRTVKVWERANGTCLATYEGHVNWVRSVAVTPDGSQIISGSEDRTVKVWERGSGTCLATYEGHVEPVLSVAVTPDGSQIISGSSDSTVKVWERASGTCLATYDGHGEPVWSVAVTPDGSQIISGSEDRTVRLRRLGPLYQWTIGHYLVPKSSRYTNAKVVLIGESGVGKSGLALRLAEDRWAETGSTHGMEVWPLRLETRHEIGEGEIGSVGQAQGAGRETEIEREVWLWDFAGQPDYRLIHQLYMAETALALLVIDPQRDDPFAPLAHWERALEMALGQQGGRSPVKLLVAARCDRGGATVSDRYIADYCRTHEYVHFCHTAAKLDADHGCGDLKAAIAQHIPWDQLPWTATTQLFRTLKETILRIKEDDMALVRVAELRQRLQLLLPDEPFTEQDLRTVIGLLAGQGLIMPLDFGDFVLLQPEQINNYASAVVRMAREQSDEIGCLPERDVLNGEIDFRGMVRLNAGDELILLRAMVQTFVERSLCLQEETSAGTLLVFPSYFRLDRPPIIDYPGIFVTYRFAGTLDEIYTTLIVRLHYTNDFAMDRLWHYAADFQTHAGRRVGLLMQKSADDQAEIQVYFEAGIPIDTKVSFIKYIHEHLRKRGQEVTRIRTYACPECSTIISHERVRQRLERGRTTISCDLCDETFSLRDLIEEKFESDEFVRTVREMDEQAQIRIDRKSLELILIGHASATANEAGQRFVLERHAELETDGYIELRDEAGEWSDERIFLKFMVDESLQIRSASRSSFNWFLPTEELRQFWLQKSGTIMTVARDVGDMIRWHDATAWLRHSVQKEREFYSAEPFTALNLERARKRMFAEMTFTSTARPK